jgi:type IV pilus assembly protein PilE
MCLRKTASSTSHRLPRAARGLTLIELMIVVALIAIMGLIAVPSYQTYVMKARRADARAALTTTAQMLERYSTENQGLGYANANTAGVIPAKSENGHYTLSTSASLTSANPVWTYTLEAARSGAQANDPCGTFTLNERGVRGIKAGTSTKSAAECW